MLLGRLETINLRDVWSSESEAFTPWLAKEQNIALLGEAIGLELEVEAQEKNVGPFRADILCKDTATDRSWSKTSLSARIIATDTQQTQLQYWTQFRDFLLERKSTLRPQKPLAQNWTNFALGRSNFWLVAFMSMRDNRITCGLVMSGPDSKANFHLLQQQQDAIEAAMHSSLEWEELPDRKESHVFLRRNDTDAADRSRWPKQHLWLAERLEAFHRTLSGRVKELGATIAEKSLRSPIGS